MQVHGDDNFRGFFSSKLESPSRQQLYGASSASVIYHARMKKQSPFTLQLLTSPGDNNDSCKNLTIYDKSSEIIIFVYGRR